LPAAKASALAIYLTVLELITVPIFALVVLDSVEGLVPFALVLVLATFGLAATGTLIRRSRRVERATSLAR
jgi:hypothetical protein